MLVCNWTVQRQIFRKFSCKQMSNSVGLKFLDYQTDGHQNKTTTTYESISEVLFGLGLKFITLFSSIPNFFHLAIEQQSTGL